MSTKKELRTSALHMRQAYECFIKKIFEKTHESTNDDDLEDFSSDAMSGYNTYPQSITPSIHEIWNSMPDYNSIGLEAGGDDAHSDLCQFIYGALLGREFIQDPYSKEILEAVKYWIKQGRPEGVKALIQGLQYDG